MDLKITSLLCAVIFIGTGCATTTPDFCQADNWKEIGYSDALAGTDYSTDQAENLCSTDDAPIAYRLGFDFGLSKYCTFEKGLFSGEHGKNPAESCSDEKWDEYQNGYIMGRKIHQANGHLESLSDQLEDQRKELWQLESAPESTHMTSQIDALKTSIQTLLHERDTESLRLTALRSGAATFQATP